MLRFCHFVKSFVGIKSSLLQVEDAMQYVFGYTVANDFSARDWQLTAGINGGQWLIGKAMDGFCPLGPAVVTPDDLDGKLVTP